MNNLFTPSAKNVLMLAQEQAKKFNHHALGTEHLLFAYTSKVTPARMSLKKLNA